MNFRKNIYTISIGATLSAVMLTFVGCGITSQDEGLGNTPKAMSGVVVDGYLAGATVYVDVNENNKLDAWEARALTDINGFYSYNAKTSVNYCTDEVTVEEGDTADDIAKNTRALRRHCLEAPAGYDSVMVRMTGGYDLSTVEPFTGTISMKADLTSSIVTTPLAATPITGLMSEMSDDEQVQFLLSEGISADVATSDFLDYSNSLITAERQKLLNLALKAHKIADVVANLLDKEFDQGVIKGVTAEGGFFGVVEGVPVDGSLYVYRAMIEESISTSTKLSDILSNELKLRDIIDRAKTKIVDGAIKEFNDRLARDVDTDEYNDPDKVLLAPATIAAANHATLVFKIADTVDAVFGTAVTLDDTALEIDVVSRMRAIDAVVSLTRAGEAGSAIDNAVNLAKTDAAYLANLREPSVDMASLKRKFADSTGTGTAGAVVAGDADFSNRQSFNELFTAGDTAFSSNEDGGTVNTEGFAGNTLALNTASDAEAGASDEISVEFLGDTADAEAGKLKIDANLLGGDFAATKDKLDANGDPVLDSNGEVVQEPAPLALEGTWEKIDDYTMLMNIEVTEGVFEPVIVKPNENGGYYFDLGGEQIVWDGGAAPTL